MVEVGVEASLGEELLVAAALTIARAPGQDWSALDRRDVGRDEEHRPSWKTRRRLRRMPPRSAVHRREAVVEQRRRGWTSERARQRHRAASGPDASAPLPHQGASRPGSGEVGARPAARRSTALPAVAYGRRRRCCRAPRPRRGMSPAAPCRWRRAGAPAAGGGCRRHR